MSRGARSWRQEKPSQKTTHVRELHLQQLLPMWPAELADTTLAGRLRLLKRLRRALRQERRRGLAGHWSYDLARHRRLLVAYRAEAEAVAQHSKRSSLEDQRMQPG